MGNNKVGGRKSAERAINAAAVIIFANSSDGRMAISEMEDIIERELRPHLQCAVMVGDKNRKEEKMIHINEKDCNRSFIATEYRPGSLFAEDYHFPAQSLDPLEYKCDSASYAFRLKEILSISKVIKQSPTYFPDAKIFTTDEIAGLPGDHDILISNVRCNSPQKKGIRTRLGNWQFYEEGKTVVLSGDSPREEITCPQAPPPKESQRDILAKGVETVLALMELRYGKLPAENYAQGVNLLTDIIWEAHCRLSLAGTPAPKASDLDDRIQEAAVEVFDWHCCKTATGVEPIIEIETIIRKHITPALDDTQIGDRRNNAIK